MNVKRMWETKGARGVRRGRGVVRISSTTRDEIRSMERQSFTIFVNNPLESMSKGWLYQIFAWTRQIADIYISRKKRKESRCLYAFVRYDTKGGAERAISEFDGMEIRGMKISVSNSKFRRGGWNIISRPRVK